MIKQYIWCTIIIFLPTSLPAQGENWVFRYNGSADSTDLATSLAYGTDGNIYIAGRSQDLGTGANFTVISLNKDTGDSNWIYRYNALGNYADVATSIAYGVDGNIYAVGYSDSSSRDLVVVSLTPSGSERWIYRYNGPINGPDGATSIIYGTDGNIYVAGYSRGSGNPYSDFIVVSLLSTGRERWFYRYNGALDLIDAALCLVYGLDNNLYIAGYSNSDGWSSRFTVISLTAEGDERWVYQQQGSEAYCAAFSLVYGEDNNIYAAGVLTWDYFTVISLTSGGGERWAYVLPPATSACEGSANAIVYGLDGNIYAAGVSDTTSEYPLTNSDFTVVSLTLSGSERWVYRYNQQYDYASSITYGADSNVYAGGTSLRDFTVICLTPSCAVRWIYHYDGPYNDEAGPISYGADNNIYVAGFSECRNTTFAHDILVVSLDPDYAVEEKSCFVVKNRLGTTIFNGPLQLPKGKTSRVFDITGRMVMPDKMQPGIYFLEIDSKIIQKIIKVK